MGPTNDPIIWSTEPLFISLPIRSPIGIEVVTMAVTISFIAHRGEEEPARRRASPSPRLLFVILHRHQRRPAARLIVPGSA
jgi:hypothetical protein